RDRLGAPRRWTYRHPADHRCLPVELGSVGCARDFGRAISDRTGSIAAAARGRRVRRVPADRPPAHRGSIQPQPTHRAEADGAVREVSFTLRNYVAADEDAAIALWRRTWQQHYPHLDFGERLSWWRARWRDEVVATAIIMVAEADGSLIGFVTVD